MTKLDPYFRVRLTTDSTIGDGQFDQSELLGTDDHRPDKILESDDDLLVWWKPDLTSDNLLTV